MLVAQPDNDVALYIFSILNSNFEIYSQYDNLFKSISIGLVWFLYLMAYQLFLGYLLPKPFS